MDVHRSRQDIDELVLAIAGLFNFSFVTVFLLIFQLVAEALRDFLTHPVGVGIAIFIAGRQAGIDISPAVGVAGYGLRPHKLIIAGDFLPLVGVTYPPFQNQVQVLRTGVISVAVVLPGLSASQAGGRGVHNLGFGIICAPIVGHRIGGLDCSCSKVDVPVVGNRVALLIQLHGVVIVGFAAGIILGQLGEGVFPGFFLLLVRLPIQGHCAIDLLDSHFILGRRVPFHTADHALIRSPVQAHGNFMRRGVIGIPHLFHRIRSGDRVGKGENIGLIVGLIVLQYVNLHPVIAAFFYDLIALNLLRFSAVRHGIRQICPFYRPVIRLIGNQFLGKIRFMPRVGIFFQLILKLKGYRGDICIIVICPYFLCTDI